MNNPILLQKQLTKKLEELDGIKDADLNAFEHPITVLKHYKEELKFFEEGKKSFVRMIDMELTNEEEAAFENLEEFFLNTYPELELHLLRVIQVLEGKMGEVKRIKGEEGNG